MRYRIEKSGSIILAVAVALLLFISGLCYAASPASSGPEEAAAFYKGKTVEILVGLAAGGGYDTWARLLATYMGQYTGAKFVVNNMTGAGGGKALDYFYHRKNTNGLLLMFTQGHGQILFELLDFPETTLRWKSADFKYIGRTRRDINMLIVNPKFKTINDVRADKELLLAADGPLSLATLRDALYLEGLGLKSGKIVFGYSGSSKRVLAIMQGEVDGSCGSYGSRAEFLSESQLNAICSLSKDRHPDAKDVPTIFELGVTNEGKKWIEWNESGQDVGGAMMAPPDIPKNKLEFLRNVMGKAVVDPKFLADVEKAQLGLGYLEGAKVDELIKKAMVIPGSKDELKNLLNKYVK